MCGKLVLVPSTYGVGELAIFEGLRVVVLDDLLFAGFAGVYFRRLFVQAVMDPGKRVEYELRRTQYLARVLVDERFECDAVFVGTRASDVDLMAFESVYAVRVSDRSLRAMSRAVYGDPVMMHMDYHGVLAAVEQAVDETFTVAEWAEVPLLIMRKFQERVSVDVTLHAARQRAVLSEVLQGVVDAQVWLEDAVFRSGSERKTLFLADYDYLSFVRPVWRDAVVRILGKAPSVAEVFRLPWCLVDTAALHSLCYRPDVNGRPTATARGKSLIEFVQTRLAGSMTTREMIGTWVGGLLCDDLTAVDTIISLGQDTLVTTGDDVLRTFQAAGGSFVPVEYAWMYTAVNGVTVRDWDGDRRLDGMPKVGGHTRITWSPYLAFAELYADVRPDTLMSTCVVQFIGRLHSITLDIEFLVRLCAHARDIQYQGCTRANFDPVMTPMLPGYSYLVAFSSGVRLAAAQVLGVCPSLVAVLAYVRGSDVMATEVSPQELCADASRLLVFAGKPLVSHELVGQADGNRPLAEPGPGYCYECLFKPEYRLRARRALRSYPSLQQLMEPRFETWFTDDALDSVRVSYGLFVGPGGIESTVLHMASGGSGVVLRDYLLTDYKVRNASLRRLRVGQSGVCYSNTWYVSAIVAWTIVGCVVFGVFMWLLYKRCTRGRSGGSRRFY